MFTPARFCGLPGMRFPARGSHAPTKDEMADYLEAYAARFALPVRTSTRVDGLTRRGERFVVTAGSQTFEADNVVVAMANFQQPKVPPFAADLDPSIRQLHSFEYRNPAQLTDGAVLVVGVGNSGAEIAMELAKERPTWLAGHEGGHIPFHIDTFFGRNIGARGVRFAFHHVLTLRTPIGRKARPSFLTQATPLIRTKPKDLVAAGVTRVERIGSVERRPSRHRGRAGARRRQRGLEHGLPPGLLVDRPPGARRPPGTGARAGNRGAGTRPVLHRSRVPLLGVIGDRDGRRPGRATGREADPGAARAR